ncbi:hypothetical protein AB0M48_05980 [Lentzea sp. NPDC051208]|uniref:hypothetical protein n=1 Tax=Lentzea sp. NPDC051208 TaxID=3154642 RepID=UPI00342801CC
MSPSARGPAQRAAAARRITDWVHLRAGLHEAVGVARAQGAGGLGDGLETYSAGHSAMECTREAARVRGSVDAAADDRADPDWRD